MPDQAPEVVGVGLATLDQIGIGPRSRDPSVELTTFSLQAGGPTGTTLATLAAFGARTKYFGRLGKDEFGEIILRRLRSFGIDTSAVLQEPDRLSPVTFTLIEDQGRRFVRYTRGDTTPLRPVDLPSTLFDDVPLVFIDAEMPGAQIVAAERARARGARVVLGIRRMGPGIGELLDLADAVIASERVAAEIAHSADIERTLVELTKMGPEIAVVTLGDDGAVGLHQDKLVRQQALDIDVADITGAGSVFRGAFAYALLRDWPLERALPFANAAAGLNCASLGGQGGIPTLEAVEKAAGFQQPPGDAAGRTAVVNAADEPKHRGARYASLSLPQPPPQPSMGACPPPPRAPPCPVALRVPCHASPLSVAPLPTSRPSNPSSGGQCAAGSWLVPSLACL